MIEALVIILVVHLILFIINPDFFMWCILGVYVILGCILYEIYLSTRGEDFISKYKRGEV